MSSPIQRRKFVAALAALPAAPALLAQQTSPAGGSPAAARPPVEAAKIDVASTDVVAEPVLRYFTQPQFAALSRVCDLLMPPLNGAPGALDAKAPEFLDFLIHESPADRQQVYRAGLDALNAHAKKQFGKEFAELRAADADAILAPLRQPWTYDAPADPLDRFLRIAKQDVRTATLNSREYNAGGSASGGGRRFGGTGSYWRTLD